MSRITALRLENFRTFANTQSFAIAPITFVTGTNGSGKSSIIKSLLLLSENAKDNQLSRLNFTGTTHNLGAWQGVASKYCQKDFFRFGTSTHANGLLKDLFKENEFETEWLFFQNGEAHCSFHDTEKQALFSLVLNQADDLDSTPPHIVNLNTKWAFGAFELFDKHNLERILNTQDEVICIGIAKAIHTYFGTFDPKAFTDSQLLPYDVFDESFKPSFQKLFQLYHTHFLNFDRVTFGHITPFLDFENWNSDQIAAFKANAFIPLSEILALHFKIYFSAALKPCLALMFNESLANLSEIRHVAAVRSESQRIHTATGRNAFIGLLNNVSSQGSVYNAAFIDKWLQKFELGDRLIIENIEGVAWQLFIQQGEKKINVVDMGYGVSQLLPILLEIQLHFQPFSKDNLFFRKKILLLEEPETNLHPKLQSLLGEMIVDAINTFHIQFIIETHSEYIIRNLQYLTAKRSVNGADVQVYYLGEDPEADDYVKKINFKPNGMLTQQFGEGFFDESSKTIGELWKLRNLS